MVFQKQLDLLLLLEIVLTTNDAIQVGFSFMLLIASSCKLQIKNVFNIVIFKKTFFSGNVQEVCCPDGTVFNPNTGLCDCPNNVPDCGCEKPEEPNYG